MDPEIRGFWENTDSNEIISDLKEIYELQVLLMKHDCLDEFLSCKMEEHTSVEIHLKKMNGIHMRLTIELEYEMTDALVNSVILRSLPPSYREFVRGFVMKGEAVTFQQLLARVRTLKVEPIEGEIVDPSRIFRIQCYKCFINTYCSFVYMILILIF
jgi:hypothetical protein